MSTRAIGVAAVVCGVIAAWLTWNLATPRGAAAGETLSVLVVTEPLPQGEPISDAVATRLETVEIPSAFAPGDAVTSSADVVDARPVVDLAPGTWLTGALLLGGESAAGDPRLRRGERAVTVDVLVSPSGHPLAAGDRVDLYASGFGGDDRTSVELTGAEVLAVTGSDAARTQATLRLSDDQVDGVIRADVFAKELRAVVLP